MEVIKTIAELRARLAREQQVAVVPTMGNIHEGHLRLMRLAHEQASCVVATIFVNRLQFNQPDDFDRYPRTLEEDCAKLAADKVHIVFNPDEREMYPQPQIYMVDPPPIANKLEGRFRPGHFRGMATVVLKLFNIVQPQVAVFGKKDYQQLHIVRHMVEQLALPINIIEAETRRSGDGFALSSRNRFLTTAEREEAPRIFRVLNQVKAAVETGERNFEAMEFAADAELARHGWRVDYVVVRSRATLAVPEPGDKALVVLGAAKLGAVRLIDNVEALAP